MTIIKKFVWLFSTIAVLLLATAVFSHHVFKTGQAKVTTLVDTMQPLERSFLEVETELAEFVRAIRNFPRRGTDAPELTVRKEQFLATKNNFSRTVSQFGQWSHDENRQRLISKFEAIGQDIITLGDRITDLHEQQLAAKDAIDAAIEHALTTIDKYNNQKGLEPATGARRLALTNAVAESLQDYAFASAIYLETNRPRVLLRRQSAHESFLVNLRAAIAGLADGFLVRREVQQAFVDVQSLTDRQINLGGQINAGLMQLGQQHEAADSLLDKRLQPLIESDVQALGQETVALVKIIFYAVNGLIIFVCLGLLVLWWFTRYRILAPVSELSDAAHRLAAGDFEGKVSVRNSGDELCRLAASFNEMTERLKTASRDLVAAKNLADSASREKGRFLADMSHEIRTPLTAITGFSDLLANNPALTKSQLDTAVQVINRSSKHLAELINEVLDLAKIEAGLLELSIVEVDITSEIDTVLIVMEAKATAAGLGFHVDYLTPWPDKVRADPLRIRQILFNIIGNAIKFTERGHVAIQLSCAKMPDCAQTLQFTIEVRDTGCGIPADKFEQVFQPFKQVGGGARQSLGTGLGLDLARNLARKMGGDVVIKESRIDQGTTMELRLELAAAQIRQEPALSSADPFSPTRFWQTLAKDRPLTGRRILLIEDSLEIQALFQEVLHSAGALVDAATDGQEGLRLGLEHRFELIFMDMQLPLLDGYHLVAQLRAAGCVAPIIALTANAQADERQRCLAAGCDDYHSKPVPFDHLIKLALFWLKTAARSDQQAEIVEQLP